MKLRVRADFGGCVLLALPRAGLESKPGRGARHSYFIQHKLIKINITENIFEESLRLFFVLTAKFHFEKQFERLDYSLAFE